MIAIYCNICSGDLSYCPNNLYDITLKSGFIGTTDDDYLVTSPFQGNYDGTNTEGVKIAKEVNDYGQSFTICFDETKVSGTQQYGVIGLVDSNGNGQQCPVTDTVPDFCGPQEIPTEGMISYQQTQITIL